MAFLDGNQTLRLCEPLKQYIEARGGQVLLDQPLASNPPSDKIAARKHITADRMLFAYVSQQGSDVPKTGEVCSRESLL